MTTNSLLPEAPITHAEMLACVDRELAMRAKVYPRWVSQGKLRQDQADHEMRAMRAVRGVIVAART